MELSSLFVLLFCILLYVFAYASKQSKLNNLQNGSHISTEELLAIEVLDDSSLYQVEIIRQSGNHHSFKGVNVSKTEALGAVIATLNRSGIHELIITTNHQYSLHGYRMHVSHRGRNEGKKVGGFKIDRV